MEYIGIALLFILGIFMLLKPKAIWKIEHVFTVKNGEPTEFYLFRMRIGGILSMAISVVSLIIVLI